MAKWSRKRGAASNILVAFLQDSSVTTGAGKTGLTFSSAGLIISLRRELVATATNYTAAGSTVETITTLGTFATPTATKCRFKEVDATNQPGMYELQFDNALFDASDTSRYITGMVTATGVAPVPIEIELTANDNQDGVRSGMTALPNAAAEAAGGLYTRGTGAGQINQNAIGQVDSRAVAIAVNAIDAAAVASAAANKIADQTLRRTYANARASADGDAVNFRSLLGGVGKLVNKVAVSGTNLLIYQEDDVTTTAPGGTQAITTTVGADPITTLDTV